MEEEKEIKTPHVHWREMTDKNYLAAEQFEPGIDKIYTIKAVVMTELINPVRPEEAPDTKPVLYFKETNMKLALNSVNSETITELYPESAGYVDGWVGKKVQLFATTTKAFNRVVPCIRIRNFIPELKCSVCGKVIDEATYFGSINKYGKPLCSKECLEKSKEGKKIL